MAFCVFTLYVCVCVSVYRCKPHTCWWNTGSHGDHLHGNRTRSLAAKRRHWRLSRVSEHSDQLTLQPLLQDVTMFYTVEVRVTMFYVCKSMVRGTIFCSWACLGGVMTTAWLLAQQLHVSLSGQPELNRLTMFFLILYWHWLIGVCEQN